MHLLDTVYALRQQELNALVERMNRAHHSGVETMRATINPNIVPEDYDDFDSISGELELRRVSTEASLQAVGAESHETLVEINRVQLRFVRALSTLLREIHRRHLEDTSAARDALRDVEEATKENLLLLAEYQQVQQEFQQRSLGLGHRIHDGFSAFARAMSAEQ